MGVEEDIKKLFLFIAVIALFTSGLGADYFSDAEALKSKGTGTSQYGSSTNICGLQLCSEIPGGKDAWMKDLKTSVQKPVEEGPLEKESKMEAEEEPSLLAKYFEQFDPSNPTLPDGAEMLFVQVGESGSFLKTGDGYLLTIFNVSPQVIYFTDRPYHLVGHMTTLDWAFGIWQDELIDFKNNPPNGILVVFGAFDESNEIALELHNAKYIAEEGTMQYDVVVLGDYFEELQGQERQQDTEIPEKFGDVSLFIDKIHICKKCTAEYHKVKDKVKEGLKTEYHKIDPKDKVGKALTSVVDTAKNIGCVAGESAGGQAGKALGCAMGQQLGTAVVEKEVSLATGGDSDSGGIDFADVTLKALKDSELQTKYNLSHETISKIISQIAVENNSERISKAAYGIAIEIIQSYKEGNYEIPDSIMPPEGSFPPEGVPADLLDQMIAAENWALPEGIVTKMKNNLKTQISGELALPEGTEGTGAGETSGELALPEGTGVEGELSSLFNDATEGLEMPKEVANQMNQKISSESEALENALEEEMNAVVNELLTDSDATFAKLAEGLGEGAATTFGMDLAEEIGEEMPAKFIEEFGF